MKTKIILLLISFAVTTISFAQSSKKKKKKEEEVDIVQPSAKAPNNVKEYKPKKLKKSSTPSLTYYESDKAYQERMEKTVKTIRKNERMMESPQYSDPTYFGHKRPPKRHKPGKMKFCKVCGIRH